jgi:hypothetical protein
MTTQHLAGRRDYYWWPLLVVASSARLGGSNEKGGLLVVSPATVNPVYHIIVYQYSIWRGVGQPSRRVTKNHCTIDSMKHSKQLTLTHMLSSFLHG